MSLGATIFGVEGLALSADERAFYGEANPFGFILFARNVDTPHQLRRLTDDLRKSVGWHAPIFVDQEGGRVQRLRAPHWAEWLPPLEAVARAGDQAPRMMWLRARLIAAELLEMGIDGNCAPCLDLATDVTHPFLKNRCYGTDMKAVSALGRATADGHLAGGVLPVIKHMPGHGRANADTHHDLPCVTTDAETLRATDFAAFRALNDLPLAMTAHIIYSAFDDQPATCSASMMRVMREEIGFAGLIMSDDLNMQALSGSLEQRAARAIAAGCDIALHCKGTLAEFAATAKVSGTVAQSRVDAAFARRQPPEAADLVALAAEHDALIGAYV